MRKARQLQGKILIADAIATNRIVLKVKLKKAYYDVFLAATMADALALTESERPDLIICALDLPGGGAADLCRALTADVSTEHIPIIATGSQTDGATRLQTLHAGVRDVLDQPVDEMLLLGRVRSLVRAHNATAEWQMREDTCRALGLAEDSSVFDEQGSCALISDDHSLLQSCANALRPELHTKLTLANAASALASVGIAPVPDVFVLILPDDRDAASEKLRLISTLRANAMTRHSGVIAVQSSEDGHLGAHALDLGADDLMTKGFNARELALRTRAVLRRKKTSDRLRATVRTGLQAAVFDPLTGLYNRRYAMPHLDRVAAHAKAQGRRFAVMLLDLDHFKQINDVYGHAAGDAVLVEVAARLRRAMRGTDMVARIGGEEFLIIMPGMSGSEAHEAAVRICGDISSAPFTVPEHQFQIHVTTSIGMAVGSVNAASADDSKLDGAALLAQADRALYAAKGRGRNQVNVGRPAA